MASENDASAPIDLTLAKIISRKLGKLEFSRGGDLAYRIDHPRKPILWGFRRKLTIRLGALRIWKITPIDLTLAPKLFREN